MIPFITSRTSTRRLLPPRLAGGIKGSTCAHSSSVRSLGYRNLLRSQRPRFFAVHIGGAPLESGHHFESQTIQRIQNVFGRTLRHVIDEGRLLGKAGFVAPSDILMFPVYWHTRGIALPAA